MIRKLRNFIRHPQQSFVYFIESEESGCIKIGFSVDVERRLSGLRSATPCKLNLLLAVPGGPLEEARLHGAFLKEHKSGEWFHGYGRLRSFVEWLVTLPESERAAAISNPTERERLDWKEKDIDPDKMIANMLSVLEEEYGEEFAKKLWARAVARKPKPAMELPRTLHLLRQDLIEEVSNEKAHAVVMEVRDRL